MPAYTYDHILLIVLVLPQLDEFRYYGHYMYRENVYGNLLCLCVLLFFFAFFMTYIPSIYYSFFSCVQPPTFLLLKFSSFILPFSNQTVSSPSDYLIPIILTLLHLIISCLTFFFSSSFLYFFFLQLLIRITVRSECQKGTITMSRNFCWSAVLMR